MNRGLLSLKFNNAFQVILWGVYTVVSLMAAVLVIIDLDKPSSYSMLFLLPLVFGGCSVVFVRVYTFSLDNLGVTLILTLFFIRASIHPLLMSIYGYSDAIASNVDSDMYFVLLMMAYEMVAVFMAMLYTLNNADNDSHFEDNILVKRKNADKLYKWVLTFALCALIACVMIAPQLLMGYRTIFQIGEEHFSSYEDTWLISTYGTTTLLKFALVTGNYLFRALLAILPGVLIVSLSKKKTVFRKLLAFICCFIPIFFIGGVIGRSLIYVVCFLLLYFYVYSYDKVSQKTFLIFVFAACAVIAWWLFNNDNSELKNFTGNLNAYFSGVNNVFAAYKLQGNLETRFAYFIYDFMDAIPYGGTIFHSNHVIVSDFFNSSSGVRGQIPPTIGMSRFYFGPLLSPLYSVVFASISVKAGHKALKSVNSEPIKLMRLLLTAMYFSMGIIMYSVSITMTNFFTILLPMYIMEKIAYKK